MQFHTVWFRLDTPLTLWDVLPIGRDSGTLTLDTNALRFRGKKWSVRFPVTRISRINYGRQGIDWINTWVTLESDRSGRILVKDGRLLGWRGIFGGTNRIFKEIIRATASLSPAPYVTRRNHITRSGYTLLAFTVIMWFATDPLISAILSLLKSRHRHRTTF